MGVCSSNVYPALLFDQEPAQSSTLRLGSVLLTLPRQPGRNRTGTGLSPLQESQQVPVPIILASPSSTCLRKGYPECHWGVTPSHHTSHTQPCPTRAAQGKEMAHPSPTQRDPHSPLSQVQREQETSLLSPVKPVRAAPHLPLYPMWLRCTWSCLAAPG